MDLLNKKIFNVETKSSKIKHFQKGACLVEVNPASKYKVNNGIIR